MVIPGLNSKVLDKIITTLGLQSAVEKLPTSLAPTIQPVIIANPDTNVDVVETTAGSGTIYVTPTDRDFYLTSACVSSASLNNGATSSDSITIILENGATKTIIRNICCSSATGQDSSAIFGNYCGCPIKLKRGSTITAVKSSTTAGFTITGYFV